VNKRFIIMSLVQCVLLIALVLGLILPNHLVVAGEGTISFVTTEYGVAADISDWLQEYEYREPFTTEIEPNKYEINYGGEIVQVGKGTRIFSPDVTLYRWDKECYLTIGEPVINDTVISQKNPGTTLTVNDIGWNSNGLGFKFYPKTQTEQNEYGSFEYEITLVDSKAGTGELLREISFPIHSSGLEFYYQPELTQKEIDDGAYRPENVIGSYAVYHSSKKNHVIGQVNYGAGKAFHIYRPMLIDSKGSKVYADLIITEDSLTIDCSKIGEWLEKANYPVTIDPEFGYTGAGGSSDTWPTNYWVGLLATSPADAATGTSWKIYQSAKMHDGGSATGNCKGVIYLGSSKARVTNGVGGVSNQITATKAWVHSDYSSSPTVLNSTSHYIGVVFGNASSGQFDGYYDTTGAGWYDGIPGGYAAPGTPLDPSSRDRNHSVYATYTSSFTANIANTPSTKAFGVVADNTTYYAYGSAPSNPVTDGQCTFTITNNGDTAKINIKGANATGGTGWTLVATAPSTNQYRITCYASGTNPASGIVLTTSDQQFIASLAASGTKKWDLKLETGFSTDGVEKSAVITLTAVAP